MGEIIAIPKPANSERPRLGAMARGVLIGGLVAGSIDIFAASVINLANPAIILQFIASGLLGPASLHGGAATAALGLVLQLAMSVLIAAIYGSASLRLPILLRRPIGAGVLFGVGVFLVMNMVVVPLSAAPHPKHPPSFGAIGLNLAAMILFGLIVAISQARSAIKPPR